MLLQIFILEACPDLQEKKGDKKDTHAQIYTYTYSLMVRQQIFGSERQNT